MKKKIFYGTTVNTKEQEGYLEVYMTYEVLENIETYEKIEYWKDDKLNGREKFKNNWSE